MSYIAYMGKQDLELAEWESAVQKELEDLRKRKESLDNEIQRIAKKLELIRQMRVLEATPDHPKPAAPSPAADTRATPIAVRDAVRKILTESPQPLHIAQIHREFLTRGIPIPGRGTAFNILAHVVNDKNFVRVARGTYALAGSVPADRVLPKAQRRQRVRRRKKRIALPKEEN